MSKPSGASNIAAQTAPAKVPTGQRLPIRPLTLGRKNYLFAGSDAGGRRAAILYTLIETARFNGIDPEAWLTDVIARIADHPISKIDEMLPWAWAENPPQTAAA